MKTTTNKIAVNTIIVQKGTLLSFLQNIFGTKLNIYGINIIIDACDTLEKIKYDQEVKSIESILTTVKNENTNANDNVDNK